MSDADIDQALDACERTEDAIASQTEEEPDAGSSGAPISVTPSPPIDERLADAAHTLRLIARRIEFYRRAAACC
jgi:hypothetical protein